MNEWSQLEKELQSWTPRAPSARLKERLFGVPDAYATTVTGVLPGSPAWNWLVPATCALMLTLSFWLMHADRSGYAASVTGSNVLASISLPRHFMAVSHNADLAVNIDPDAIAPEWNVWSMAKSVTTFDWTKGVNSLSTTGSFPLWNTNLHKL